MAWHARHGLCFELGRLGSLEGLDDCSITRRSALESGGFPSFLRVGQLELIDGDQTIEMPEGTSATPGDGYYTYSAGLTTQGVAPRFGGTYGLRGGGGWFGTYFELDDITLPQDLQLDLGQPAHLDPAAPTLRWTGAGADPVRIYISLRGRASGGGGRAEIYCELADDGEHVLDPNLFWASKPTRRLYPQAGSEESTTRWRTGRWRPSRGCPTCSKRRGARVAMAATRWPRASSITGRIRAAVLVQERVSVPSPVVAEWWRGGRRQTRFQNLFRPKGLSVEPTSFEVAKLAGEAIAKTGVTAIDPIVMLGQRIEVMSLQAVFPGVRLFGVA